MRTEAAQGFSGGIFTMKILTAFLLALAFGASLVGRQSTALQAADKQVPVPSETAGWDAVLQTLFSTVAHEDVLALGEAHGRQIDSDLRLRVIEHPDFPRRFSFVIVELGDTHDQRLIDAYVYDGTASEANAAPLWSRWSEMKVLYSAIRDLNLRLSPAVRVRVLAATEDFNARDRDSFAANLVENQVYAGHKKALLVYGAGHVWHRRGGITTALEQRHPGSVFVVEVHAPASAPPDSPDFKQRDAYLARLERVVRTSERPVLLRTQGTKVGRMLANDYYGDDNLFPPGTTVGDLDDAVLYAGRAPQLGARIR